MESIEEACARLQRLEISVHGAASSLDMLTQQHTAAAAAETNDADLAQSSSTASSCSPIEILQLQVDELKTRLLDAVRRREQEDRVFQQAMVYASAKSTANAVLHTLFDQAKAGKHSVLADWFETGVIITRNGLEHWRVDVRDVRNEDGSTLLHAAVGRTMAREDLKVKLVAFLLDTVGFDANVRDLFGRTALHIAAMSNYHEVVKSLLAHGCDPTIQDRAGLTALSSVRTLSQPYEDIVKTLTAAEKARDQSTRTRHVRELKDAMQALASALFLQRLRPWVLPEQLAAFTVQTTHLVNALLLVPSNARVAFDEFVRSHVPVLFTKQHDALQVARLDTLVTRSIVSDESFLDALRIEIDGFGLSLVSQPLATSAIAGATWIGVLLKLIQHVKHHAPVIARAPDALCPRHDVDVEMASERQGVESDPAPLPSPLTLPRNAPSPVASSGGRQLWHYAVLYRASTHPLPGTLALRKGVAMATASESVSAYFPLDDRLVIGKDEYVVVAYNAQTQELELDRPFEGRDALGVQAYLSRSCSTLLPPFIKAKQILERAPGNKYEDQNSDEQELFQDYQFLDPESDYEVAVKFGPVPTAKAARALADEWKQQCRAHFDARTCVSGLKACEHSCPQRSGQSLCCETMMVLGRELAKTRFGREKFSRALKPRAALQRYQSRFRGTDAWPGSPSTTTTASSLRGSSTRDTVVQGSSDA